MEEALTGIFDGQQEVHSSPSLYEVNVGNRCTADGEHENLTVSSGRFKLARLIRFGGQVR